MNGSIVGSTARVLWRGEGPLHCPSPTPMLVFFYIEFRGSTTILLSLTMSKYSSSIYTRDGTVYYSIIIVVALILEASVPIYCFSPEDYLLVWPQQVVGSERADRQYACKKEE